MKKKSTKEAAQDEIGMLKCAGERRVHERRQLNRSRQQEFLIRRRWLRGVQRRQWSAQRGQQLKSAPDSLLRRRNRHPRDVEAMLLRAMQRRTTFVPVGR